MSKKYVKGVGRLLESKNGKLRIELNGLQMKALVDSLSKFGESNYKGKDKDQVIEMDRSRDFLNFTVFIQDPHPKAPDFVKGELFLVEDAE
jgi:hypothetical protein